jgi:hypothetical protein
VKYSYDDLEESKSLSKLQRELSLDMIKVNPDGSLSVLIMGRDISADELQQVVNVLREIKAGIYEL